MADTSNSFNIDLDKVRAFLRHKEETRREKLRLRWDQARNDCDTIIHHIISVYNPPRIYQWGSLLDFSGFSEISDIDIALEGLSGAEEYFAILGDAMEMTNFPLDIIEIDKIDPAMAELIIQNGKVVYERKD